MTTQTHDPVIETNICQHCGSSFDITQSDMDFYNKISPRFPSSSTPLAEGGQGGADATTRGDYVAQIPTPTLCPDCRQRRRLAFRNERKLYRRICDASQQPIISIYSPDKSYTVYDQKIRRSDARDALDYGRDFDFSRTFTEQFGEMMREVPLPSLTNLNAENSEYCNWCNYNKDCYLCFMTSYSQNSIYGTLIQKSDDCVDCEFAVESNNCYQCFNVNNCSYVFYSHNSQDCSHSSYLDYCRGCTHCYACNNMQNKSYCIMNKQYPKEEYFEVIKIIKDEDIAHHKKHVLEEESIIGSENCTGSEMINCKNCHHSHNGFMAENCKYCLNFGDMVDAYDCSAFGHKCSLSIENIAGEEDHHVGFTFAILNAKKVRFSLYCINSSHLFGCIGLRNQEYCIFNKQYTKEEYNKLVPQIIEHMKKTGEWGEFFHPSLSPFGYNETVANEYFPVQPPSIPPSGGSSDAAVPLSGGEGLGVRKLQDLGYKRSDYEAPTPQVDKIVPGEKLPAQGCAIIQEKKPEFLQDILKYAIRCEKSQKLFRLIPQEIAFYTKHDLPLPRRHPDVRHAERMEMRR